MLELKNSKNKKHNAVSAVHASVLGAVAWVYYDVVTVWWGAAAVPLFVFVVALVAVDTENRHGREVEAGRGSGSGG
jgi:hypothetical protein